MLHKKWFEAEQKQADFSGWDFSYVNERSEMDRLPWCYSTIINKYLQSTDRLLDMGTGGGELLATFHHPPEQTSVTEGWAKNYDLLLRKLEPTGVTVKFVAEDDVLDFPDEAFDIVLNSHESFSIEEVKRVLKKGGLFITQQVGDMNGVLLASKLIPGFGKMQFCWHLFDVTAQLKDAGFEVLYQHEAYPAQRFFDMEGLIYYVRTIPWEFPDFSVATHLQQLEELAEELKRNGQILNQGHRFVIVARKST